VQSQFKAFKRPFHTHQKQAGGAVLMLIRMQDVGVMLQQEIGDGGDQSLLVRAGDEKNSGITHGEFDPVGAVQKMLAMIPRPPIQIVGRSAQKLGGFLLSLDHFSASFYPQSVDKSCQSGFDQPVC